MRSDTLFSFALAAIFTLSTIAGPMDSKVASIAVGRRQETAGGPQPVTGSAMPAPTLMVKGTGDLPLMAKSTGKVMPPPMAKGSGGIMAPMAMGPGVATPSAKGTGNMMPPMIAKGTRAATIAKDTGTRPPLAVSTPTAGMTPSTASIASPSEAFDVPLDINSLQATQKAPAAKPVPKSSAVAGISSIEISRPSTN